MSAYVSVDNQNLLWNVISKNEIVNNYFSIYSNYPYLKNEWFKSIIQIFYEDNQGKQLDSSQLLLLNKRTISYMIKNIKDKYSTINKKPNIQLSEKDLLKPYSITENKVDKIGDQFQIKQVEYQSLFDKKVPDTIDFAEKQDIPLSNMDDLIKQHLKEREDELRKYAPLPPTQSESNKLKIDSNSNINILIEELTEQESDDNEKIKKSVSWSDNTNAEKISNQQIEIDLLKLQIRELFDKLSILENKYNM
uniref:Uncharacterized protein n=1 Tax=viral metagenome TaxID=1070528 RepID=A0A6C0JMN3_9ZZZZ